MNLNNQADINKLDTNFTADSISLLSQQIKDVWTNQPKISFPKNYKACDKIVVSGMGGSNLGARIIKDVFNQDLKLPIIICAGYDVPRFVNKKTLFILSSYSGNTEETLASYNLAKKAGAKIIVLTAKTEKNKLVELVFKHDLPAYIFDAQYNPSAQPRLALGYAIFALVAILKQLNLVKLSQTTLKTILQNLEEKNKNLITSINKNNAAKNLATKLQNKQIILIGGEFLEGNLHALRNQINENCKNFASYLIVPELNHYAMEGLAHPKANQKDLIFLFIDSKLYHPRVQERINLTKEVIKKNKIKFLTHELSSATRLEQSLELLQFGSWATFYLAMLNNVNPAKIPFVDWFKNNLK